MFKIDYHIHTTMSPDGRQTLDGQIAAAAAAGIDEIAITDHCECNNNLAIPSGYPRWFEFDVQGYTAAIDAAEKHGVKVRTGIELGQITQNKEYGEKILKAYDWDFVLGSLHNLDGNYDFYFLGLDKVDMRPLMDDYFSQLYDLACYNRFSVLSHLYYPVKYIYTAGQSFDIFEYTGQIEQIFKKVIENGKGIEVNTSALKCPYRNIVPEQKFLQLYHDLGGEIITIGSDSHSSETIGLGVEQAIDALKQCGFKAITTFEKQKPIFIDI